MTNNMDRKQLWEAAFNQAELEAEKLAYEELKNDFRVNATIWKNIYAQYQNYLMKQWQKLLKKEAGWDKTSREADRRSWKWFENDDLEVVRTQAENNNTQMFKISAWKESTKTQGGKTVAKWLEVCALFFFVFLQHPPVCVGVCVCVMYHIFLCFFFKGTETRGRRIAAAGC